MPGKFHRIGDRITHPSHRRLVRGLFWLFSGNLISQFITFVILVALARYWGKAGYGEYGIITATVLFFSELAGIGLGTTAIKYISQYRVQDPSFTRSLLGTLTILCLGSALTFSLLFFLFPGAIATRYLNTPEITDQIRITSVLLFLVTMNGFMIAILTGFEKFREIMTVNLTRAVIAIPVTFLGVYFLDLTGAILALILLYAVMLVGQWRCLTGTLRTLDITIRWKIDRQVLSRVWSFGISVFLTGIVLSVSIWMANIIIVHQSPGIGEVGMVNLANQWRVILAFLPAVLIQVLLPLLSSSLEEGQQADYQRMLSLSMNIINLVMYPVCTLLMLFTPFIISWYGPTFLNGEMALTGMFLASLMAGITSIAGPVLQSREKIWTAFFLNLAWSAVLIVSLAGFGNRFGASSYTYGSVAGYLPVTVLLVIYLRKHMPGVMGFTALMPVFHGCIVAAACIINLHSRSLLLSGGITIYIIISTFSLTDPKTRKALKQLITRQNK